MTRVLIFATPARDDDDPLARTRFMADRTDERLRAGGHQCTPVLDDRATRDQLERSLDSADIKGVGFFCHGCAAYVGQDRDTGRPLVQDDALIGADDKPALDADNLAIMAGRWGHAVACNAGTELAARACAAGAVCFVGYNVSIEVPWAPADIPPDIVERFVDLLTCTTCALADGIYDELTLQRRANDIAEDIAAWCEDHESEAEALGLEVTTHQLVNRMVVAGGRDRADSA